MRLLSIFDYSLFLEAWGSRCWNNGDGSKVMGSWFSEKDFIILDFFERYLFIYKNCSNRYTYSLENYSWAKLQTLLWPEVTIFLSSFFIFLFWLDLPQKTYKSLHWIWNNIVSTLNHRFSTLEEESHVLPHEKNIDRPLS